MASRLGVDITILFRNMNSENLSNEKTLYLALAIMNGILVSPVDTYFDDPVVFLNPNSFNYHELYSLTQHHHHCQT